LRLLLGPRAFPFLYLLFPALLPTGENSLVLDGANNAWGIAVFPVKLAAIANANGSKVSNSNGSGGSKVSNSNGSGGSKVSNSNGNGSGSGGSQGGGPIGEWQQGKFHRGGQGPTSPANPSRDANDGGNSSSGGSEDVVGKATPRHAHIDGGRAGLFHEALIRANAAPPPTEGRGASDDAAAPFSLDEALLQVAWARGGGGVVGSCGGALLATNALASNLSRMVSGGLFCCVKLFFQSLPFLALGLRLLLGLQCIFSSSLHCASATQIPASQLGVQLFCCTPGDLGPAQGSTGIYRGSHLLVAAALRRALQATAPPGDAARFALPWAALEAALKDASEPFAADHPASAAAAAAAGRSHGRPLAGLLEQPHLRNGGVVLLHGATVHGAMACARSMAANPNPNPYPNPRAPKPSHAAAATVPRVIMNAKVGAGVCAKRRKRRNP
jgi:hypothetical protein